MARTSLNFVPSEFLGFLVGRVNHLLSVFVVDAPSLPSVR